MKNPTSTELKNHGGSEAKKELRRYQQPEILSYTGEELLEEIGPAQGYNGLPPTDL